MQLLHSQFTFTVGTALSNAPFATYLPLGNRHVLRTQETRAQYIDIQVLLDDANADRGPLLFTLQRHAQLLESGALRGLGESRCGEEEDVLSIPVGGCLFA